MERMTHRRVAALLITGVAVGAAHGACRTAPDEGAWLVSVEHLSTYPAGPEWNTRITVFEDGCLVMEAPTALRVGGGRTEGDIPEIHLDGITAVVKAEALHALSAERLVTEMKRVGHTDLSRLGADSVTDAPYTVVRFRDPAAKVESQAVEIYALSRLTVPPALGQLATVQDLVRTIDRLALSVAQSRPAASTVDADRQEGR